MDPTAREEVLLELYRQLSVEQRNELLRGLRALAHANQVSQTKMKKPLDVVGNGRIEAKYGLPKAPPKGTNGRKPHRRGPDRAQDDNA